MSEFAEPNLRRIIVLLVDDQRMIAEVVRRQLLDQADIAFHYCGDSAEAVTRANELQPHIILQDLVMPGLDGLELTRLYRSHPATARTPVVLLTASDDGSMQHQAFEAGASAFLTKLPSKVELVACIRQHVVLP
jgi:two-component system chemotaxis family response regulator WspR